MIKLNIAFASSLASQIGLESAIKHQELIIDKLFLLPSFEQKTNPRLNHIFQAHERILKVTIIKSTIQKVLILLLMDIIKILCAIRILEVNMILPRPFWIFSILGPKKGINTFGKLMNVFNNKNYKYLYYGDGLSCFCHESKPFWLKTNHNYQATTTKENKYSIYYYYYHMMDSESSFEKLLSEKQINSFKLGPVDLMNSIQYAYTQISKTYDFTKFLKTKETELPVNKIQIFTTTTFSKTKRCTIEEEIRLYLKYIKDHINLNNSHVILKLHPSGGKQINEIVRKKIRNSYPNRIIFDDPYLNNIPLEVLIFYLTKHACIPEENIVLYSCSSGTAMPKTLFPNIKLKIAFGIEYLKDIISTNYLSKRITQEILMDEKFNS